jgi:hypothetical protein
MRAQILLWTALAGVLCGFACGRSDNGASSANGETDDKVAAKIASIDPCTLVTKDEIQAAIEAKRDPSELASLKRQGVAWTISTTPEGEGESRVCRIHWQGTLGGAMQERGDMSVNVYKAEYFNSQVSDMNRVRRRNGRSDLSPIPGIGDEAHYFGYSETGNPEARVGDLAVGVESLSGKPSVDLLRAAVSRVH